MQHLAKQWPVPPRQIHSPPLPDFPALVEKQGKTKKGAEAPLLYEAESVAERLAQPPVVSSAVQAAVRQNHDTLCSTEVSGTFRPQVQLVAA